MNDDIRSHTEAFVSDITALIRKAALDAVRAALGAAQVPAPAKAVAPAKKAAPAKAAPAKKAAPAPAKKVAKAAPAPKAAPGKKAAAPKRPVGAKRPPAELAALVEKLNGYIKSNPGQGAEAIGKALGLPTSEMTLPIKKLLGSKRIRSEGQKRATKYFPA